MGESKAGFNGRRTLKSLSTCILIFHIGMQTLLSISAGLAKFNLNVRFNSRQANHSDKDPEEQKQILHTCGLA